jgi:hypothetical protein
MKDPKLLEEAERLHIEIAPIDGKALAQIVADIVTTPKPVIERVKAALGAPAKESKSK